MIGWCIDSRRVATRPPGPPCPLLHSRCTWCPRQLTGPRRRLALRVGLAGLL